MWKLRSMKIRQQNGNGMKPRN
ncbi:UNVERIFIED_CONTAM: hypothetical protein GTU68_040281 [Idotea baltica]|nr:hypothetical protein [Idotea baltica]